MDALGLNPTTITDSLMQSLAVPLLLGTIASFVILALWIVSKIITAVQLRRAYTDLKEARRLLDDLNRRDCIRFASERRRGMIADEDIVAGEQ